LATVLRHHERLFYNQQERTPCPMSNQGILHARRHPYRYRGRHLLFPDFQVVASPKIGSHAR
jgi:hypothetical protein